MELIDNKINEINKKFKNNALVSGVVNILILGLVLVFFSIGFDITKNILTDFVNLSWSNIFPSLLDLVTIITMIMLLKSFLKILKEPDFLLHINTEVTEVNDPQSKIKDFVQNDYQGNFVALIISFIVMIVLNYALNVTLEEINGQLSPINEWYIISQLFVKLPIFPINLLGICILMGVIIPTALHYQKYQLKIAELMDLPKKEKSKIEFQIYNKISLIKVYRAFIYIILAIFCIALSLIQKSEMWIFKYSTPINQEKTLYQKGLFLVCEDIIFDKKHDKDIINQPIIQSYGYYSESKKDNIYVITPSLKETLKNKCDIKS